MMKSLGTSRVVAVLCAVILPALSGCVTKGEFNTKLAGLAMQIESSQKGMTANKAQIADATTKLKALAGDVQAMRSKLAKLPAIEKRLSTTEGSLVQQSTALGKLTTGIDKAAADVAKLTATLGKLSADVDGKVTQLAAADAALDKKISRTSNISERVVGDLKAVKDFSVKLDGRMKDLIVRVDKTMADHSGTIADHRKAIAAVLGAEYVVLRDRMGQLKATIDALKAPPAGAPVKK